MNDTRIQGRSFGLRYDEMDARGEATPVALIGLLEETAFSHCESAGWDVFRLVGEGYGWILLRGGLEMRRYPAYGERFRVETWLSEARRFYGTREFSIRTDKGEELGYARSLWVFYGLERRRPLPILDEILAAWAPNGERAGPLELGEIAGPVGSCGPSGPSAASPDEGAAEGWTALERRFDVRQADIDTNGHVNNVNYLAWALEALPPEYGEARFLSSIRGQYKREVTLGQSVRPRAEPDGEGGLRFGIYADQPGGASFLAAAAECRFLPRPAAAPPKAWLGRARRSASAPAL